MLGSTRAAGSHWAPDSQCWGATVTPTGGLSSSGPSSSGRGSHVRARGGATSAEQIDDCDAGVGRQHAAGLDQVGPPQVVR
ncbi:MAG: hypothetical protein ACHQNA_09455, partial [Acidimicrobiales bacterium]